MVYFSFSNLLEQLIEFRIVTNQDQPNKETHRVKCEKALLRKNTKFNQVDLKNLMALLRDS